MKRRIIAAVAALALTFGAVACSGDSQYDATHDDTGYHGRDYRDAEVIIMPDGFPNVATKCDAFSEGHRIYVGTRKGETASVPMIVDDPSCHVDLSQVNYDHSYKSPDKP
jgi:hypothetical protein